MHDKILSRANLIRRGWSGSPHSAICGHVLETTEHLFIQCLLTIQVWRFFLVDITCLANMVIADLFSLCNKSRFAVHVHGWYILVNAILWCIWLNRNAIVFRQNGLTLNALIYHVL